MWHEQSKFMSHVFSRPASSEVVSLPMSFFVVGVDLVLTKCHGAEASCGVDDEAQPVHLVLALPLSLLVARGRYNIVGVVVEVAEGGE